MTRSTRRLTPSGRGRVDTTSRQHKLVSGTEKESRGQARRSWGIGDISGAFADLGTFIPLVSGVVLIGNFDPMRVLIGFGAFAIATGFIYRRPVPVQPMKAVAALAITGSLSAEIVSASGILIGLVLIVLALSGLIERLQSLIPRSVLQGVQLGLGISLIVSAIGVSGMSLWLSGVLVGLLLAAQMTVLGSFSALVLLAGGVAIAMFSGAPAPSLPGFDVSALAIDIPPWDAFAQASVTMVLPQIALTLTNAVLLTALLSADYFPQSRDRITARNLALSSGGLNAVLTPFGAIPMCHGAGGLAAHYAMGARTGLAPIVFGLACILLAMIAGPSAMAWLKMVPGEVVAALLAFAGVQLMSLNKVVREAPAVLLVIGLTALVSLVTNVAIGLLAGLAAARIQALLETR